MKKIFVSIIYVYKKELEEIIDDVDDSVRVRSRCHWCREGEKSSKFFLNLENNVGFRDK